MPFLMPPFPMPPLTMPPLTISTIAMSIPMAPSLTLPVTTIAAALLDFLLKSSLCFLATLLLAKLLLSARLRFAAWLTYIAGTLAYAIALTLPIIKTLLSPDSPKNIAAQATAAAPAALGTMPATHPALWTLPATLAPAATLLLALAATAYAATLALSLTRHLRQQSRLRHALLFAYAPPEPLTDLVQSLLASESQSSGQSSGQSSRHPTLLVLPGLTSPATIGWLHPIVLLPPGCEDQPLDQTADILRHELHHILRRDWLLERIASTTQSLLCFQPCLRFAIRHLRLERELACDQAVLKACTANTTNRNADSSPELIQTTSQKSSQAARLHYAESLLQVARLARRVARTLPDSASNSSFELASGIEFAASTSQLETRIRAVLARPRRYPRGLHSLVALTSAVLLVALAAGLPYLTVTLAFTASSNPTPPNTYALSDSDNQSLTPSYRPTRFRTTKLLPATERLQLLHHSPIQNLTRLKPSEPTPAKSNALASATRSAIPAAPAILIATTHETTHGPRLRLEPAADTEDPLPTSSTANTLAQTERGGPISTTTNPAIQASDPTHNVVSVLADAAILLSRRDTGHDDH